MFARTETFKQFIGRYPVLSTLVVAFAAVYLVTLFAYGGEQPERVYELGGIYPGALDAGEWWRFGSYAFLHAGFSHVLMNSAFLLILAPPLEYMLGRLRFIGLFLVSVVTTSLLVFAAGHAAGVGASGFGYGVLGVYAVIALRRRDLLDRTSAQVVWSWIGIGWIGTLIIPGISILGHLGGFLGGLAFGLVVLRPGARLRVWAAISGTEGRHPAGNEAEREEERNGPA